MGKLTINLCEELHQKIREDVAADESLTTSLLMERIIREHYEGPKPRPRIESGGRTMAFSVSEELFQRGKRYLAVIRERTDAMRTMTEELFRYSVVTAATDELNREPVCLNHVLEQSLAGFYSALSARGITPEIQLAETAVVRELDAAALRRIFDNILSNAAKYSDGDLVVRLMPNGAVTFTNSAQSLNRVQAERLFDRFFTVETASGSTGLGLSIADSIVSKHGGKIWAESADGVNTFFVQLSAA